MPNVIRQSVAPSGHESHFPDHRLRILSDHLAEYRRVLLRLPFCKQWVVFTSVHVSAVGGFSIRCSVSLVIKKQCVHLDYA